MFFLQLTQRSFMIYVHVQYFGVFFSVSSLFVSLCVVYVSGCCLNNLAELPLSLHTVATFLAPIL